MREAQKIVATALLAWLLIGLTSRPAGAGGISDVGRIAAALERIANSLEGMAAKRGTVDDPFPYPGNRP